MFSCFRAFHVFTFSHISRFAHLAYFTHFMFQIPRVFVHLTYCTHFTIPQFTFRALAYLACFVFSHSRIFRALTCTTARLPGIHRIPFACPVLILQGPLVCISLCFTCITSYMSLHSHLCSLISLCVYITSPLYV